MVSLFMTWVSAFLYDYMPSVGMFNRRIFTVASNINI